MKQPFRWLKNRMLDQKIRQRFGTAHPDRIVLFGTEHTLYVDPYDIRARRKIIAASARGRVHRNQRFWRMAIQWFRPDTALDIGVNYGECLFSMDYAPATRLFGFEANSALQKFLDKSRDVHPNSAQMNLMFCLVSDQADGVEDFYIDRQWSGGSTAAISSTNYDSERYLKVPTPRCIIDKALESHRCSPRKVFFKIDVEGYEEKVLKGMRQTLDVAEGAIGFVEFDEALLVQAGTDVADYWDALRDQFDVHVFDKRDRLHLASEMDIQALREVCGKHFHTDLLLLKSHEHGFFGGLLEERRAQTSRAAAA